MAILISPLFLMRWKMKSILLLILYWEIYKICNSFVLAEVQK